MIPRTCSGLKRAHCFFQWENVCYLISTFGSGQLPQPDLDLLQSSDDLSHGKTIPVHRLLFDAQWTGLLDEGERFISFKCREGDPV